jgi:hypothetical protein
VIPSEPVLSEAKDFESIQPVKISGPGNTEQGAVKPRTSLLSFSTPVRATDMALVCGHSVARLTFSATRSGIKLVRLQC